MNSKKAKALRKQAGGNEAIYEIEKLSRVLPGTNYGGDPLSWVVYLATLAEDCTRKTYKILKQQYKTTGGTV